MVHLVSQFDLGSYWLLEVHLVANVSSPSVYLIALETPVGCRFLVVLKGATVIMVLRETSCGRGELRVAV